MLMAMLALGCGGGGGGATTSTGTVTIQVDWPGRFTDDVPTYANSIVATLTQGTANFVLTINRSGNAAYTGSAPFTQGIPVGAYTLTVRAYTATNGQGSAVATSSQAVNVQTGQNPPVNVSANLQSTVDHVIIDNQPISVVVNTSLQLQAHAENAANQTLLLPPSALTWSLMAGQGTLSIAGLFQSAFEGTNTVRVTETASAIHTDATVTVTAPPQAVYTIAFASDRDAGGKLDSLDIYSMNADGSSVQRLTSDSALAHSPSFSFNGTKIAFASNKDGTPEIGFTDEIYSMSASGTSLVRLTNNDSDDSDPSYSPDGTKIVFAASRDGNWEIYRMTSTGTSPTRLTNNLAEDRQPHYNSAASKIVFTSTRAGNQQIFTMNADGTSQTNVSNNAFNDYSGAWNPGGTKIVFVSDRDGDEEIYIMNANGSSVTRLTNSTSLDTSPVFTQDGQKIVFVSTRDGNEELYIMNIDGTGVTRVTNTGRSEESPAVRGSP